MTMYELDNLIWMKHEARDLEKRMDEIALKIRRTGNKGLRDALETLLEAYNTVYTGTVREETRVMTWISTIDDPVIRMVVEKRYVKGMTWPEVSGQMHCSISCCKMSLKRYLEKNS